MTPELLTLVGESLYGPSWRGALARQLEISDRTLRRWESGKPIPPTVRDDLVEICQQQIVLLENMLKTLQRQSATKRWRGA